MFSSFNFAQGSAAAMIFLAIIMVFAMPYLYFQYKGGEL
jgi:ABC-type sugar transport system permease subunit